MNYHNEIRAEVDIVMSVTRYSNDETEIVGHRWIFYELLRDGEVEFIT